MLGNRSHLLRPLVCGVWFAPNACALSLFCSVQKVNTLANSVFSGTDEIAKMSELLGRQENQILVVKSKCLLQLKHGGKIGQGRMCVFCLPIAMRAVAMCIYHVGPSRRCDFKLCSTNSSVGNAVHACFCHSYQCMHFLLLRIYRISWLITCKPCITCSAVMCTWQSVHMILCQINRYSSTGMNTYQGQTLIIPAT